MDNFWLPCGCWNSEPRYSARATNARNSWASSPAPQFLGYFCAIGFYSGISCFNLRAHYPSPLADSIPLSLLLTLPGLLAPGTPFLQFKPGTGGLVKSLRFFPCALQSLCWNGCGSTCDQMLLCGHSCRAFLELDCLHCGHSCGHIDLNEKTYTILNHWSVNTHRQSGGASISGIS